MNRFGDLFSFITFGESHGPLIGCVIDGVRPGLELDVEAIQADLDKRRPGQSTLTTQRKEADSCEVVSGVFEGKTTGAPVCILIRNTDQRSRDYSHIKHVFRPGHASYTWLQKYGMFDYRGGGRASGRETAMRVAAAGVAKQLLPREVVVRAGTVTIGDVVATQRDWNEVTNNAVRCPDTIAAQHMEQAIESAAAVGDSVGGIIEIVVSGVPVGWGEPVYEKLEAEIAKAVMSVGAVKGVEFGNGFASTRKRGSQNNDELSMQNGSPAFLSNHAGGILGGVSNGEDIVMRVAIKPTSSVGVSQRTLTTDMQETDIRTQGRHDPCICPRVVPVLEAMVILVLCDMHLKQQQRKETELTRATAVLHAGMMLASVRSEDKEQSLGTTEIRQKLAELSLSPDEIETLLKLL